jgi:hypothetical protein
MEAKGEEAKEIKRGDPEDQRMEDRNDGCIGFRPWTL